MADYPDDCIQGIVNDWWQEDKGKTLCRGALVSTYVQFYSQVPLELIAERIDPTTHKVAGIKAQPLNAEGKRSIAESLPVAGLPRLEGAHCYITNRAKKRPCIILGAVDQKSIDRGLTKGMIKSSTHQFFIVAPFFSVEQAGRSGYNPEFVERVMHADYRAFFWDILPGTQGHESILRMDQIQPVGIHNHAYKHLGYRLSDEALAIFDEWLDWVIYNKKSDTVSLFRDLLID